MKLESFEISKFRSLCDFSIRLCNFTSLIGPNNSGKSTVLRAIQIFLDQEKPAIEEWPTNEPHCEIEFVGTFSEIQDWERSKPGISGLIYDNKIKLRYRAVRDGDKVDIFYDAFVVSEEITGWSEDWSEVSGEVKDIARTLDISTAQKWRTRVSKERVRQIIRDSRRDLLIEGQPQWTDESISILPAFKQAMPQIIFVPAITDPEEMLKSGSKNIFGTLVNKIILPAIQGTREYAELTRALDAVKEKLSATDEGLPAVREIVANLTSRLSSIFSARVLLTAESPDFGKVLGSIAGIRVDDGAETPVYLQGHGVQRSVVFALLEVLAKEESRVSLADSSTGVRSSIILFEEPELFMHPHLMRRLKYSLTEMAARSDFQVIITTHSPILVNVADDRRSLVIFRKPDATGPSEIVQVESDPFANDSESRELLRAAIDFHPTICEAFFARNTVLVEGDSEIAVFGGHSKLAEVIGVASEIIHNTTIVSCGGKWTILPIAKLLKAFEIPFKIVHDKDRKNRTDAELASLHALDPFNVNERVSRLVDASSIFVVDDTLEDILFDSNHGVKKDKPYQCWKRAVALAADRNLLMSNTRLVSLINFIFG